MSAKQYGVGNEGKNPPLQSPLSHSVPSGGITVEAWVRADRSGAEAMQALVSQWYPAEEPSFSAYDAIHTDDLLCAGYYGAVFDGRYVYNCPIRSHPDRASVHGHVLRFDTHRNFHEPASWRAYDAAGTDELHTVCYYGAAFDGRHVIFTPRDDGERYHSRVLRCDTKKDFHDPAAWSAHDAGLPHSGQGVAHDGRFLYFCPGYESIPGEDLNESHQSGHVLRMDTAGEFRDASSYAVFDTTTLHPRARCFDGGLYDGRYIYLIPLLHGVVARYDPQSEFGSCDGWELFDAAPLGMELNVGAIFDGRFVYFCSYGYDRMFRYDTRLPFTDGSSWEYYDAAGTGGLETGGFDGGFFDGRYIYYCPWTRKAAADESGYHCNFLRFDTTKGFSDPSAWSGYDASETDGLRSLGYNAGAFDGRYFYAAPLFDGKSDAFHGTVLRCDTLGSGGGAFSLRYSDCGHNGGLCAAVPGPTFLINTESGARSISTHRPLDPGTHHLVGVYDGIRLRLFIDGQLEVEREVRGNLVPSDLPVAVGDLGPGTSCFSGQINAVELAPVAWTAGKIARRFAAGPRVGA
ncbi:MAG: LamG-like jellyroll fold domain-containing protein [Candidatus Latescibacterota bacterium]|nr:LamG-like jellyroll fold domain-containing protein [Candidatus Latescibacterota bacterium]